MPIHMDTRNEVAILAMDNSPENAFTSDMIQQFNATLDRIEADDKIRGVVVTGADGQFFSSGMDLQYVMKLEAKAIKIFFKTLFTFFHRTFVPHKVSLIGCPSSQEKARLKNLFPIKFKKRMASFSMG